MSSSMSTLESAAKHLSPEDRDQFFKIKRDMETAGESITSIEERLHMFIWQVIDADDDDDDDDELDEE